MDNKNTIETQIKILEQNIKFNQDEIEKLKGKLNSKAKPNLNDLFKNYLHVWLYFPGCEDKSFMVYMNSVEEISGAEIGFLGIIIELGTPNSNFMGVKVDVKPCEYSCEGFHKFNAFPYICTYGDDLDCAITIKKQIDACIEEKIIVKVSVEEAKNIILSHMYWTLYEGTEENILPETENPLRDFNKPYTIADKA